MSKQPDSRPYFKVEQCRASDNSNRPAWRIVSIAGGDTVATGIPTKEYAEVCRQALEKELIK